MGVSLNLNPRIRYSDLGGEQQRRANEDAYWHKADMPHTATNVCFWQKSGRLYNLRVLERTDTRHAVGSNPVSAQFLWKTGTMPKMSRDFWHNSPKNFQIRDAENQCLR